MKKLIVSAAAVALTFGAATSVSAEEYEVEKGDTLWDIANEYNVEVNSLMDNNDLDSDLIHPAQILQIDNESSDSAESSDDNGASDEEDQATEEESSDEEETNNTDGETISAEATAYTASCDGCSGTTATGVDLNENSDEKVIAVDPDVIPL